MKIKVVKEIPISLEKVWGILSDFGNMDWAPGLEKTEVIGQGDGMIRRLYMPGMEPIDEVLTYMDNENKKFAYTIPRGMPLPVSDYQAEVTVQEADNGGCRIVWTSEAVAKGDIKAAEKMVADMYATMIDWLVDYLS